MILVQSSILDLSMRMRREQSAGRVHLHCLGKRGLVCRPLPGNVHALQAASCWRSFQLLAHHKSSLKERKDSLHTRTISEK
ncbi:unnamed protein product [Ixodes pacificus]